MVIEHQITALFATPECFVSFAEMLVIKAPCACRFPTAFQAKGGLLPGIVNVMARSRQCDGTVTADAFYTLHFPLPCHFWPALWLCQLSYNLYVIFKQKCTLLIGLLMRPFF